MNIKECLIRIVNLLQKKNNFLEFSAAIRERESNNNYQAKNSYGYLGAYQFGMARLCDLGMATQIKVNGQTGMSNNYFTWAKGNSEELFLESPKVQDILFFRHCSDYAKRISEEYKCVLGTERYGVKITLSGLIAGAHLLGMSSVRKFIDTGKNLTDGNNTSIKSYIYDFQGYDLLKLI